MIENIFLMTWNPNSTETDQQIITDAAYPDEYDRFNEPEICEKILNVHKAVLEKEYNPEVFNEDFLLVNTRAIVVDGLNLLSVILPGNNLLGLVFSKSENPYDYRNELIQLLQEYFWPNLMKVQKIAPVQTLLLTLFVDLRKYSDEVLSIQEEQNHIMLIGNVPMVKVFVFGLDNAGKSSLMRLLSTGKYDSNYFPPTKKFRITNIKLPSGVKLVCWDMPGQKIFRSDWLRGAQASNILLFILDLADSTRFEEAREELNNMLDLYELQNIPLLFLGNKTDLSEAVLDQNISFRNLD